MVFSSLQFILIFMPIFFFIYYRAPNSFKNIFLLLGSLIFYAIGTIGAPAHLAIFLISMVMDFTLGRLMDLQPKKRKHFLIAGLLVHLLFLGFYKYFPFFWGELARAVPTLQPVTVMLPIGISFYTFQGISYLADVYKKQIPAEKSLLRYCVYISMFPQLIAGPIVTYSQVRRALGNRKISKGLAMSGLGTFIFGMGLKVLLANPLGKLWSDVGAVGYESISAPLAWLALLGFSLQIYFDFFGYSLMAMGLGKMLGFQLPKNFDFPYLSLTMTQFWRRWHMTLGSWFRQYVYIPLGGNRCSTGKNIRNLMIVWILTGIWHGAGYTFLLWGLILFALIISEKYITGPFLNRFPFWGHLYMAITIPLTWAVFAAENLGRLGLMLTRLFHIYSTAPYPGDWLRYLYLYWPFFLVGTILLFRTPYRLLYNLQKYKVLMLTFLLGIFAACLLCMYQGFNDPFLYFRF